MYALPTRRRQTCPRAGLPRRDEGPDQILVGALVVLSLRSWSRFAEGGPVALPDLRGPARSAYRVTRTGADTVTWSSSDTLTVAFIVQVPGRGRSKESVDQ